MGSWLDGQHLLQLELWRKVTYLSSISVVECFSIVMLRRSTRIVSAINTSSRVPFFFFFFVCISVGGVVYCEILATVCRKLRKPNIYPNPPCQSPQLSWPSLGCHCCRRAELPVTMSFLGAPTVCCYWNISGQIIILLYYFLASVVRPFCPIECEWPLLMVLLLHSGHR